MVANALFGSYYCIYYELKLIVHKSSGVYSLTEFLFTRFIIFLRLDSDLTSNIIVFRSAFDTNLSLLFICSIKFRNFLISAHQGLTSPLGLDQVFWDKDLQVQVQVQVLIQILNNTLKNTFSEIKLS